MSPNREIMRKFRFALSNLAGWYKVDDLVRIAEEAGAFDDMTEADMAAAYKKSRIRQMMRGSKVRARESAKHEGEEWVNVVSVDENGKKTRLYKQHKFFNEGDYVNKVTDCHQRSKLWNNEAVYWADQAVKKFGSRIKDLIPTQKGLFENQDED